MAVTTTTASNPLISTTVVDADANLTIETVGTGNKNLYAVEINNSSASAVYLHLLNLTNADYTSQPSTQLYCAAGTSCYYYFKTKYETTTGIQFYCSTTSGGGTNAVAPSAGSVSVKFGFTDR